MPDPEHLEPERRITDLRKYVYECCEAVSKGDATESIAVILWAVIQDRLSEQTRRAEKAEAERDEARAEAFRERIKRRMVEDKEVLDGLMEGREGQPESGGDSLLGPSSPEAKAPPLSESVQDWQARAQALESRLEAIQEAWESDDDAELVRLLDPVERR